MRVSYSVACKDSDDCLKLHEDEVRWLTDFKDIHIVCYVILPFSALGHIYLWIMRYINVV